MNVSWVLSQTIREGFADPDVLKSVGPLWGSWRQWKEYKLDNTVCTELGEAELLMKRAMHAVTNLYMPQSFYATLGRPTGLKYYDGEFKGAALKNKDDIVAMNLPAASSDIVLMLGFKLAPIPEDADKLEKAYENAYQFNIRAVIADNPNTQFVLVNYEYELAKMFTEFSNLTQDTLDTVIEMLL